MNSLTFHLMALVEEKEQTKPKVSRRKKIIKIRAEINRKVIEKLLKTKSWFLRRFFFLMPYQICALETLSLLFFTLVRLGKVLSLKKKNLLKNQF